MAKIRIQALTPKYVPKGSDYSRAIEAAHYRSASLVLQDLEKTTRTWEHKPDFEITVQRKGRDVIITAGTSDLIYKFVEGGTKPHPIVAKRSKYLRFLSGYRAKTRVGIIGSNAGGSFGDPVFRESVKHPGTKARKFILKIQQRRQTTLQQQVDQAIAEVNRKAQ